ncbi:ATP-binding cassette domain-containing protein [Oceanobacillus sp. 143]|nr:ATP-binding cassette domain-containing protein [Oceanobacillus sp. 143]
MNNVTRTKWLWKVNTITCHRRLRSIPRGNLFLDDSDISNTLPRDRNVGMVFQNYALFPNMTIFENIAFGLTLKKLPKDEIKREVMRVVRLVNLEDKIDHYPHQLSGDNSNVHH